MNTRKVPISSIKWIHVYLAGKSSIEEITSLTVHNASWLVGGSRGVHNEEIILTVHWHWLKLSWLHFHCLLVKILHKSVTSHVVFQAN